jgi:hypothetical protein
VLDSHYGIGFDTDVGFDVPLNGGSRTLFHVTHRAWSNETTRIRLGALGIASSGEETVEMVLGHDIGDTTLHAGVAHAFPGTTAFGGVSRVLTSSATLHAEYLGGADAEAALGCEWSLGHGLAVIVSGLHNFQGEAPGRGVAVRRSLVDQRRLTPRRAWSADAMAVPSAVLPATAMGRRSISRRTHTNPPNLARLAR